MSLSHRALLQKLAEQAMYEHGLQIDFPPTALAELPPAPAKPNAHTRDLRQLLWCSIDNEDSRDLDQLTVAEALPEGRIKVLVAIADVDALVPRGSALDQRAQQNTVSVYTPTAVFPMLPVRLSTNLTSLNYQEDRVTLVVEMVVDPTGDIPAFDVYLAQVHSYARLSYNAVAAWLEGTAPAPAALTAMPSLEANLQMQWQAAQRLQMRRSQRGALSFETTELDLIFEDEELKASLIKRKNRAQTLIENLMIAANSLNARFLTQRHYPSIRRVVHAPKRWPRIVALAAEKGASLPPEPDSRALEAFLQTAKAADPLRFPDLSAAVIKLLGGSEYVAELPDDQEPDHFGLALQDYTHSTAPNRRYTDLITHRLIKAALAGEPTPYNFEALQTLAKHCTTVENIANKVERQANKAALALLLQPRIGEEFDALVTGMAAKGTWVRLLGIPVEGRLVASAKKVDVGDQLRVRLTATDVEQGFIDFQAV